MIRWPKKTTWILIADGARAHIVASDGPGKGLRPVGRQGFIADHRKTSEIGAERPGRTKDRFGQGRHALEPKVDWHAYEKALFAKRMAEVLNRARRQGDFDALVLVAPPKSLGELRAALDAQTQERIVATLAKDLTSVPVRELPEYLAEVVRF